MYVISLTTIEKQQDAVDIHLLPRGNRTKNRILLVGRFECHLSSLTLPLSLSLPLSFSECGKAIDIIIPRKKNSPVSTTLALFSALLRNRSSLACSCRSNYDGDFNSNFVAVRRRPIARDHRQAV